MSDNVNAESVEKPVDYKKELERAYRALGAFYIQIANGKIPDQTMLGYHSPTIGAALRYMNEEALDGSEFFIGKPVEVLHSTLALAKR